VNSTCLEITKRLKLDLSKQWRSAKTTNTQMMDSGEHCTIEENKPTCARWIGVNIDGYIQKMNKIKVECRADRWIGK
jgi:hypothetical protein